MAEMGEGSGSGGTGGTGVLSALADLLAQKLPNRILQRVNWRWTSIPIGLAPNATQVLAYSITRIWAIVTPGGTALNLFIGPDSTVSSTKFLWNSQPTTPWFLNRWDHGDLCTLPYWAVLPSGAFNATIFEMYYLP